MSETNNSCVIENIDLPLYKYGLIHKQNINNYLVTEKQKKFQKFKSYALTAIFFVIIIRLLLHFKFYKNPNYPLFYFDPLNYFSGLTQFTYAIYLLGSVFGLRLIYLFNYSDESLYKWLDIIEVLKGLKSLDSIGLKKNKEYESFVKRIKFFEFLIEISIKIILIVSLFFCMGLTFLVYDTIQSLFFGILNTMFHWFWTNCAFGIESYSFLFYFIVCYYSKIRFKILNNIISRNSKLPVVKLTARIIREHNDVCNDILRYDKFWNKFYFALTYTIIPINLMLLHLILFDDLILTSFLIFSMVVIIYLFSHIVLNLISASVNKNALKSHKYLFKFQTKFSSRINLKQKIKVKKIILKFWKIVKQLFLIVIELNGKSWRSESHYRTLLWQSICDNSYDYV
jgi:hypothetical protein